MKKSLIIIGAVLLSAFLGFLVPRVINDGTMGKNVDIQQLQANFQQELATLLERQAKEEAIKAAYEAAYDAMQAERISGKISEISPDEPKNTTNNPDEDQLDEETENFLSSDTEIENDSPNSDSAVEETPSEVMAIEDDAELPKAVDTSIKDIEISDDIPVPELEDDLTEAEVKLVKDQWVQDQINANRASIDDQDLYTGAEIYNQLDTGYLFGLAEDGLTEAEKAEAEAYLRANLSEGQLDIAITLYTKYVHLLD